MEQAQFYLLDFSGTVLNEYGMASAPKELSLDGHTDQVNRIHNWVL